MKKPKLNAVAALLLCLVFLGGCAGVPASPTATPGTSPAPTETPSDSPEPTGTPSDSPEEPTLPLPDSFLLLSFSSGAGAWTTELLLQRDGTFTGLFNDSDMGVTGEGYPNGTRYVCTFSGRFSDFRQIDEYSCALTLSELTSDYEKGREWIEDGVLYVSSVPYGLEEGTEFILYLPDTPTEGLSEEFLSWWPGRFSQEPPKTLELFGLYTVEMEHGLFG